MIWKSFSQPVTFLTQLLWAVAAMAVLESGDARAQTTSRYETFCFGVCYYPEQWPESYWEEDARRMQECGVNTVRMGEFGWALMEPREGHYDFSLFDRAIETLGAARNKNDFRHAHGDAAQMAHAQIS